MENNRRFTPDNITELKKNEVFVFGSNMDGRHIGGAARTAVEKFGAVMGQAEGPQGQSYAIPTLDREMVRVTEEQLQTSLEKFAAHAICNSHKTFYLTKIGCGIAGFSEEEMAEVIFHTSLPNNVIIPQEFAFLKGSVTGYKGFKSDLICRGKKYEIGDVFVEDEAILCSKGLHFCENPHDVFAYYSAGEGNRFCMVDASDVSIKKDNDSKRVAKRLRINVEISVFDICKIAVSAFFENFGFKKKIGSADTITAGNYGAAQAGDWGAAQAGYKGAAKAGDWGAAQAGDWGAAQAGNKGAAQAGDYGAAQAGDWGAAQAGDKGAAQAGDYGAAQAGYKGAAKAGDWGAAQAGDKGAAQAGDCGAAIVSNDGKVKGGYGCVLVARNIIWTGDRYQVTDWAAAIVDGERIKADTWYRLVNGELKEVEE